MSLDGFGEGLNWNVFSFPHSYHYDITTSIARWPNDKIFITNRSSVRGSCPNQDFEVLKTQIYLSSALPYYYYSPTYTQCTHSEVLQGQAITPFHHCVECVSLLSNRTMEQNSEPAHSSSLWHPFQKKLTTTAKYTLPHGNITSSSTPDLLLTHTKNQFPHPHNNLSSKVN